MLIQERGFKNVAQFADAIGVRITYAYKWAGGTTPERENLEKLAAFFKVSPAWLLFGDDVPREPLRRRGKKVVAGLVGALMLMATGGVPGHAGTLQDVGSAGTSDNSTRGITSITALVLRRWALGLRDLARLELWACAV